MTRALMLVLAMVIITIPAWAWAADNPCARYADESLRQAKSNDFLGAGFKGNPWSKDRKLHYNWCRGDRKNLNSTPGQLAGREKKLQEFAVKRNLSACTRYAKESQRQAKTSKSLKTGFKGNAWSNDFNMHKQWCLKGTNYRNTPGHLASRETKLQKFAIKQAKGKKVKPAP